MKTVAIYPGSFNPFHIGHLNIVEKAERIFGKGNVVIAMGINPDKMDVHKSEQFHLKNEQSKELSHKIGREVIVYSDFLHQVIEHYEELGYTVVVVKGLRNGHDLDYEVNQMRFVNDFKKDVNVVYITCDRDFEHISSSAIRKLQSFSPGSGDRYLI
jgi:pantetheine-phosphate adenylyltransferase